MATVSLSVFLFKQDVAGIREAVRQDREVRRFNVRVGGVRAQLFALTTAQKSPSWTSFLAPRVDPAQIGRTSSVSAALVLPIEGRVFAVCFGYGRFLLALDRIDESFGLRVCLNALDPARVRSIDKKSFEQVPIQTREQLSREAEIQQFGINVERDLLRAITGRPHDAELARRLTGMDALSASVGIELDELPDLLRRFLELSESEAYRQDFAWVDQLREVRSKEQKAQLEAEVVRRIGADDLDGIWMSLPEVLDWTEIDGFRYSNQPARPLEADVYLPDLLEGLPEQTQFRDAHLRSIHVKGIREADGQVLREWPLKKCLYAEVVRDGAHYVFSDGSWYSVAQDFVAEVDAAVREIGGLEVELPEYFGEKEREFNQKASDESRGELAFVDAKNIRHGGGHSQIELCDLFSRERKFIHVKRYTGSSTLSHLFAQAAVSAELVLSDRNFREKARARLPKTHADLIPLDLPAVREFSVGLVVLSNSAREVRLPFFSKVTLRSVRNRLSSMQVPLQLATVRKVRQD